MTYLLNTGPKRVVRWKLKRFWAERGLIRCEDGADNSFTVVSVETMKKHVEAVNDMLSNSVRNRVGIAEYADEVFAHQTFVLEMTDLIRLAQEQGTPDDPTAVRDLARRAPKKVRITAEVPTFDL